MSDPSDDLEHIEEYQRHIIDKTRWFLHNLNTEKVQMPTLYLEEQRQDLVRILGAY
jgi:hypothetical protein